MFFPTRQAHHKITAGSCTQLGFIPIHICCKLPVSLTYATIARFNIDITFWMLLTDVAICYYICLSTICCHILFHISPWCFPKVYQLGWSSLRCLGRKFWPCPTGCGPWFSLCNLFWGQDFSLFIIVPKTAFRWIYKIYEPNGLDEMKTSSNDWPREV